MEDKIQALADLFKETGHAHHQAYIDTDGADPDWPLWYAEYLYEKLPQHLNDASPTKSDIVYLLVHLNAIQVMDAPGADWMRFYAKALLERYV